jgi:iron complex transport system substrate-binding protein
LASNPDRRVASLLPAATEIVCAIGGADLLVGVSHECDHPARVRDLSRLTRSRLPGSSGDPRAWVGSAEIDRDVASLLGKALGIYDIDLAALSAADPSVIITQDLCEVCAVSRTALERALAELLLPEVELVSLNPLRLDDLWADMLRVGAALDLVESARREVDALQRRVSAIASRAAAASTRPSVLAIEWIDPVMIGGLWMPELIELAGGRPLCAQAGERARTLSRSELAALSPDLVLIKPCGFDLARTAEEADVLRELVAAMPWPACDRDQVYAADGNAFFNRPGPRLVESLEILAACTHPGLFPDLLDRHAAAFVPLSRLEPAHG